MQKTTNNMTLEELQEKITATKADDLKLYLITRGLKDNVKKSSKVIDKYKYTAYQVDINDDIRVYLYDVVNTQIETIVKKEYAMMDYDVISDDSGHIFTYPMVNKVSAFSHVLQEIADNSLSKMSSIEEIISDGSEIWAYSIGLYDATTNDYIYTFRKVLTNKVAVDEKEGMKRIPFVRTFFDTTNQKLALLKGQTLNLDKQVDCIYSQNTFYIFQKNNFEKIVGLEDDFKIEAIKLVEELKELPDFIGIETLEKLIETKPSIHKKLVRIARIGNYKNITLSFINTMKKVCRKYGEKLNVKDGKLCIENDKDVDVILKMLADYYKTGDVSGKPYGTYSGKEIKK